jgi:hypothetical protein
MSLQTFKKKSVINSLGVKISGKPTNNFWISQGPENNNVPYGTSGFSLQGGRRNQGYVGKTYQMSKNGTPFYGIFPIGYGGCCGKYPKSQPLLNCPEVKVDTRGKQYRYVKQSVISTKGMLEKKYKWINNGQYPNFWVQPVYCNNNLSDNASQQVYIENKAANSITVNNTNNQYKFLNYYKKHGPMNCSTTTAKYKSFNIISSNAPYTKLLTIPQESSQYTQQIQRKCVNPIGPQKPFPFASNNTKSPGIGSLSSSTPIQGPPSNIPTPIYLEPPEWYVDPCKNNIT